ncbi:MAG: hypothetical protein OER88_08105 [Planctomycetota bacterium]|nr:hypothetical protein [Planctomycetota bacterium]
MKHLWIPAVLALAALATAGQESAEKTRANLTASLAKYEQALLKRTSALAAADRTTLAAARQTLERFTPLGKVAVTTMRANQALLSAEATVRAKAGEKAAAALLQEMARGYGVLAKAWDSAGKPLPTAIALKRVDRAWRVHGAETKQNAPQPDDDTQAKIKTARQALASFDVARKNTAGVFAALAAGYRDLAGLEVDGDRVTKARTLQSNLVKAIALEPQVAAGETPPALPAPSP